MKKSIILMILVIGIMMLFPTLVNASISEIAKIMADDNKTNDYFGYSVSISSDGKTAIVGSPYAYDNDIMVGVGYIFRWDGTTWTQQAKILASDKEVSDYFGQSVSISSNGNTAIVGADREDDGGSMAGAAYIFRWNGTNWTEQAKILASDKESSDRFGRSVSISSDGETAIVGAEMEDGGYLSAGAAYIFRWNGTNWTQQAKIQASDKAEGDYFGNSVSISYDGNTAIVGAKGEDTGGSSAGAAYILKWNGTTWTQQAKIHASDAEAVDSFGWSVSISSDGNSAIVGSYYEDTGGSDAGAAYIFRWNGTNWTQQIKIMADDAQASDYFGKSVSISSDGNTAIVGANGEDTGGLGAGAAYIFEWTGTTWIQQIKIMASDAQAADSFGHSVSISSEGNTTLIGAYSEDTGGTNAGAAYFFKDGIIYPNYSNFTPSETTNFSAVDVTDVTSMTLAIDNKGKIAFPSNHSINADGENYDLNVKIEDAMIYVDSSALHPSFNDSATLTFYNVDCSKPYVFYSETASTFAAILGENQRCLAPLCTNIGCVGSTLTVDVAHFTGFAIGTNANLTIEAEAGVKMPSDPIKFYAWYINSTDGTSISGECNISFDDNWTAKYPMDYNGSEYNYTKSSGFATAGTHDYNVTCSNASFVTLEANDTKVVGSVDIPEFSTITLGLGLIAVLGGLFVIRKKK